MDDFAVVGTLHQLWIVLVLLTSMMALSAAPLICGLALPPGTRNPSRLLTQVVVEALYSEGLQDRRSFRLR